MLVVCNDPRLDRRRSRAVDDNTLDRKLRLADDLKQLLAAVVGADDTNEERLTPERLNVLGDVRRAPQACLLGFHIDHRHGSFG